MYLRHTLASTLHDGYKGQMFAFYIQQSLPTVWSVYLPALIGALVGGFFALSAQALERRRREKAAVRALVVEMLQNFVVLSSWRRAAVDSVSTPPFPELGRAVFDQQLPLVAPRLAVRELLAVAQGYTALFALAPGLKFLVERGNKLSAENLAHAQKAAERFKNVSTALTARAMNKRERRDFDVLMGGTDSRKSSAAPP